MNNKTLTALGCLLMLGASVAPGVIAHIEEDTGVGLPRPSTGLWQDKNLVAGGGGTAFANPHFDQCAGSPPSFPLGFGDCVGFGGGPGNSIDRVSGWYIGPAGPFVSFTHDDPLDVETSVSTGGGAGFCDLEVVDGLGILDETQVEGQPWTGVPDNTFNDGGIGVVCHVNYGMAFPAEWSTPGCGEAYNSVAHGGGRAASPHAGGYGAPNDPIIPTRNGNAVAEDAVFGAEVWIGTACDWSHPTGPATDVTLLDILLSDVLDAINCVLAQDLTCFLPPGPPPPVFTDTWNCLVGNTVACLTTQIDCLLGNSNCPQSGSGTACGDDGAADAGYFGEGDGHQVATGASPFGTDEETDWQVPGFNPPPPGVVPGGTGGGFANDYWDDGVDETGVPFPVASCTDGYAAVFLFAGVNVVYEEDAGNTDEAGAAQATLLDINAAVPTHGWVA